MYQFCNELLKSDVTSRNHVVRCRGQRSRQCRIRVSRASRATSENSSATRAGKKYIYIYIRILTRHMSEFGNAMFGNLMNAITCACACMM